jgi:hypothetical protein
LIARRGLESVTRVQAARRFVGDGGHDLRHLRCASVLVVTDVFDDLSAVPPDIQWLVGHMLQTIRTRWPERSEPAVIARGFYTDDPDGDRLDEPGYETWAIALAGGPVKPGDIVEADPRDTWGPTSDAARASPKGSRTIGPVMYAEHFIVVRRAGDQ